MAAPQCKGVSAGRPCRAVKGSEIPVRPHERWFHTAEDVWSCQGSRTVRCKLQGMALATYSDEPARQRVHSTSLRPAQKHSQTRRSADQHELIGSPEHLPICVLPIDDVQVIEADAGELGLARLGEMIDGSAVSRGSALVAIDDGCEQTQVSNIVRRPAVVSTHS